MKPPQFISLERALSEIKSACEDGGEGGRSPFFFLVGSGISYPPVPLATEIIEQCKAKAVGRLNEPGQPEQQLMDAYSHWFRHAYPHPS